MGVVEKANPDRDDREVNKLQEIVEAFHAIAAAEQRYRDLLRTALANGEVKQVDVAKKLDRTREMIRQDAMTEEQRAEWRASRQQRRQQIAGRSPA